MVAASIPQKKVRISQVVLCLVEAPCLTLTYWGLDFFLVKFERMMDGGCVYWDGFWMFFFFVWYLHGSSCHPGFLFTKVEPCLESSSCKRGSFVPKSDAFGGLNGIIKHGNPNLFGV